jgi:ATP dependent DNA ligase C terminal region
VGTGMPVKVLADLRRRLDPLARKTSPLSVAPPRSTRFGSPLVLSRVHWVEPMPVAEITYLTWTADNLLRHTVYVGLREDKPATDVRSETARVRKVGYWLHGTSPLGGFLSFELMQRMTGMRKDRPFADGLAEVKSSQGGRPRGRRLVSYRCRALESRSSSLDRCGPTSRTEQGDSLPSSLLYFG